MKNFRIYISASVISFFALFSSCEKFLDEKPDIKLSTIQTLGELQGLLDSYPRLSQLGAAAAETSSDNYYLTEASYNALNDTYQALYAFRKDYLFSGSGNEWASNYVAIYQANSVILKAKEMDVKTSDQAVKDNIVGQALTFRALFFLKNVAIWSLAYDESTAHQDLGIPLKLNDNFNEKTTRPSVAQTFNQIISDFKQAIPLLQVTQVHPLRPSKATAYGLLARTYLYMRKYPEARLYADSCLQLYNALIDYNTLKATDAYPFKQFNAEVIFANRAIAGTALSQSNAKIPLELYNQYEANDLRKTLFFQKNADASYTFKGYYEGAAAMFGGLATDEMYLTRAECAARANAIGPALEDLNALLVKRYKSPGYVPITGLNADAALNRILAERRKQLLFRNLRWLDIKRLNKEGGNISVGHPIGSTNYVLPPNDLRFALAIPEDIIELTGIKQNPR